MGTSSKQGDVFCINLRFLLITLVVVANAVEPMIQQVPAVKGLFLWILTFHMPLFVFVTGYFAKNNLTGPAGIRVLKTVALQYIIFQSLYSLADVFLFEVPGIQHSFFIPYLLVWFLLSHIGWRLLLLVSLKLKLKHPIAAALLCGIVVGYLDMNGTLFSVSRTFVFLPFFFIGYYFNYETFAARFTRTKRLMAGSLSVILLITLLAVAGSMETGWLLGSFTFMQLQHQEWYAGILRLGIYALEFVALLGFLAFVPRGESKLTNWGNRTVYVFLLHGFVIRLMVLSGMYRLITNPLYVLPIVAFAIIITILLSQPRVKQVTHLLIEPQVEWVSKIIGPQGLIRLRARH